jgi:hypothetical protein
MLGLEDGGWMQAVPGGMEMGDSDRKDPMPRQGNKSPEGPFWDTPEKYGTAEALSSMGTIAAPLLGGFSLAAMVQTLTLKPGDARWPDAALLLFLLAAALFIGAMQVMFWAREYQVSPQEIISWWPDAKDRLGMLRDEQIKHAAGFKMWSNRARAAYNAALLCLLAGLTVLVVPPAESHGHILALRWAAVVIGVLAFLAEVAWIAGSFTSSKWKWAARLLTPPRHRI